MAKLVALYKKPSDKAAFDSHDFSKHIPIARKIPGLRDYEVSNGPVGTPDGESSFHLVALLSFDSLEAIQQGLASPEGAATAADLANFAQAGVDLLIFDTTGQVSLLSRIRQPEQQRAEKASQASR